MRSYSQHLFLLALLLASCSSEQQEKPPRPDSAESRVQNPRRIADSGTQRRVALDSLAVKENDASSDPLFTAVMDSEVDAIDDAFTGCSLGCAVGWEVKASSHLGSQGKNSYTAEMLNDGNAGTAWAEGVEGNGTGESITFYFPSKDFNGANDVGFWGFEIANGYHKSKQAWRENSRAKTLRVYHNGKPRYRVALIDSMGAQGVSFPGFNINAGDSVRVEVLEVYPGELYADMAISELLPMGAH